MPAPLVHPPRSIIDVAEEVCEQIRENERMSDALDAYPADRDNVHVRWLSKLRAYEVTVRFDAATFDGDSGEPAEEVKAYRERVDAFAETRHPDAR